jgi:hypothetical protein
MKIYLAQRGPDGCRVTVNGRPLSGMLGTIRPTGGGSVAGMDWSQGGAAAAEVAYALLADAVGPNEAEHLFGHYKRAVIDTLPYQGWRLTVDEVRLQAEGLKILFPTTPRDRTGRAAAQLSR